MLNRALKLKNGSKYLFKNEELSNYYYQQALELQSKKKKN